MKKKIGSTYFVLTILVLLIIALLVSLKPQKESSSPIIVDLPLGALAHLQTEEVAIIYNHLGRVLLYQEESEDCMIVEFGREFDSRVISSRFTITHEKAFHTDLISTFRHEVWVEGEESGFSNIDDHHLFPPLKFCEEKFQDSPGIYQIIIEGRVSDWDIEPCSIDDLCVTIFIETFRNDDWIYLWSLIEEENISVDYLQQKP